MTILQADKTLEADLAKMLAETLPGILVEIAHSDRWDRIGRFQQPLVCPECVRQDTRACAGFLPADRTFGQAGLVESVR